MVSSSRSSSCRLSWCFSYSSAAQGPSSPTGSYIREMFEHVCVRECVNCYIRYNAMLQYTSVAPKYSETRTQWHAKNSCIRRKQVHLKTEVVNPLGSIGDTPNQKGRFSNEAEKLLNYLLISRYQEGNLTEVDQQQRKIWV